MKKIILILAIMIFSASVASAQMEVNANAVAGNEFQALENSPADQIQAEIEKIEKQISENLQKGEPVDELEQKLQKLSAKIKKNSPYEKLRIIDGQIANAASEGLPIEALEQKRQQIIDEINLMENAQY